MKIYFFHPETGIYQGEGYEEDRQICSWEGITIVSPPDYEKGRIPVFDPQKAAWSIISIEGISSVIAGIRDNAGRRNV
jgi:hypothetical protein